jgi:hypothetical protein
LKGFLALLAAAAVGLALTARTRTPAHAAEGWFPRILTERSSEYLPDYSYAGYRWGERALPRPPVTLEVADFGAVPDDGRDDTEAFQRALKAAGDRQGQVVIGMPPGRFHLSEILFLERSRLLLRGAGSGEEGTVLVFTRPLEKMQTPGESETLRRRLRRRGKKEHGRFFSPFAWTGGVIWVRSPSFKTGGEALEAVSGRRGEALVTLQKQADVEPGQVFQVQAFNRDGEEGSLLEHLFGGSRVEPGIHLYERPARPLIGQPVTVVKVEGARLHLKEPLLHDLRPEWTPRLQPLRYLEEVGLEDFRSEFPAAPHAGHHLEEGWNGLYLTQLQHSWVRNVSIRNADSGIICNRAKNVTLEGIGVRGRSGHYCVMVGGSYGVLVKDFRFSAPSLHSPSFNAGAQLCVFSGGSVREATLDQHRGFPLQNLFDNLEVQRSAADLFARGGNPDWAPTAGAFTTFWNIRAHLDLAGKTNGTVPLWPKIQDAPRARIVGLRGNHPFSLQYGPDAYVEGLNRPGIAVPSLYDYQLRRRLAARAARDESTRP